jgi:hypothetical protein
VVLYVLIMRPYRSSLPIKEEGAFPSAFPTTVRFFQLQKLLIKFRARTSPRFADGMRKDLIEHFARYLIQFSMPARSDHSLSCQYQVSSDPISV